MFTDSRTERSTSLLTQYNDALTNLSDLLHAQHDAMSTSLATELQTQMDTYNDIRVKITDLPPEQRDNIGIVLEVITPVIDIMVTDEVHVQRAELPLEIRYRSISAVLGLINDINTLLLDLVNLVKK